MSGRGYSKVTTDASGRTRVRTQVPHVPREHMPDRQLNQAQRNMEDATAAHRARPEAGGAVLLERYTLANGTNRVMHRLGRKWQRVTVHNPRNAAPAWYIQDNASADQDKHQVTIVVTGSTFVCDLEVT